MTTFKDILAADVRSTFLNPSEFATQHEVDGRMIWAVVEYDQHGLIPKSDVTDYAETVEVHRVVLHVDPAELGGRPKQGILMQLDGKKYEVVAVADADGILVITLEANV